MNSILIQSFIFVGSKNVLIRYNDGPINPLFPRLLMVSRSFLHSSLVPHYFMLEDENTSFSVNGFYPATESNDEALDLRNKSFVAHINSILRFLVKSQTLQFTRKLKLASPPLKARGVEDTIRRFISFPYFCRTVSTLDLNGADMVTDANFGLFIQMRSLTSLSISNSGKNLSIVSLKMIKHFKELESVTLHHCQNLFYEDDTDDDDDESFLREGNIDRLIDVISSLRHLQYLKIEEALFGCRMHGATSGTEIKKALKHVDENYRGALSKTNKKLHTVVLNGITFGAFSAITFLNDLPSLRHLDIRHCNHPGHALSTNRLPHFRESIFLTLRSVSETLQVFKFGSREMAFELLDPTEFPQQNNGENDFKSYPPEFPALQYLEVSDLYVAFGLRDLTKFSFMMRNCPNLKTLRLHNSYPLVRKATEFFKQQEEIFPPTLECLDFSCINTTIISADGLTMFRTIFENPQLQKSIKKLKFGAGDHISSKVFEWIHLFQNLENLDLTNSYFNPSYNAVTYEFTEENTCYRHLRSLKKLKVLNLHSRLIALDIVEEHVIGPIESLQKLIFDFSSPRGTALNETNEVKLERLMTLARSILNKKKTLNLQLQDVVIILSFPSVADFYSCQHKIDEEARGSGVRISFDYPGAKYLLMSSLNLY